VKIIDTYFMIAETDASDVYSVGCQSWNCGSIGLSHPQHCKRQRTVPSLPFDWELGPGTSYCWITA